MIPKTLKSYIIIIQIEFNERNIESIVDATTIVKPQKCFSELCDWQGNESYQDGGERRNLRSIER